HSRLALHPLEDLLRAQRFPTVTAREEHAHLWRLEPIDQIFERLRGGPFIEIWRNDLQVHSPQCVAGCALQKVWERPGAIEEMRVKLAGRRPPLTLIGSAQKGPNGAQSGMVVRRFVS